VPEVIPGGGWSLTAENKDESTQGGVNMMRVRSGFIGNVPALGVRSELTPWIKATAFLRRARAGYCVHSQVVVQQFDLLPAGV
jgi:hypothetical protein